MTGTGWSWRRRYPLTALLETAWKYGQHGHAGWVIAVGNDIARSSQYTHVPEHYFTKYLGSADRRRNGLV